MTTDGLKHAFRATPDAALVRPDTPTIDRLSRRMSGQSIDSFWLALCESYRVLLVPSHHLLRLFIRVATLPAIREVMFGCSTLVVACHRCPKSDMPKVPFDGLTGVGVVDAAQS